MTRATLGWRHGGATTYERDGLYTHEKVSSTKGPANVLVRGAAVAGCDREGVAWAGHRCRGRWTSAVSWIAWRRARTGLIVLEGVEAGGWEYD